MQNPIFQWLMIGVMLITLAMAVAKLSFGMLLLLIILIVVALGAAIYWALKKRPDLVERFYKYKAVKVVVDLVCKATGEQRPGFEQQPEQPFRLQHPGDFDQAKQELKHAVRGHDGIIDRVLDRISGEMDLRRQKLTLYRTPPLGVFLLAGPDGLGKTYLAAGFGNALYTKPEHFQVDLKDYADDASAAALFFGSPQAEGLLNAALRKVPHLTAILEHVDALSPAMAGKLEQLLRSGGCTDAKTGKWVSSENALFFLTTTRGSTILDAIKDPAGTQRWKSRAADELSAELQFPKSLFMRCSDILLFRALDAKGKALVVVNAMRDYCSRFRIELDWIDPEILVHETLQITDADGLSLVPSRVETLLHEHLVEAARSGQRKLRLLNDMVAAEVLPAIRPAPLVEREPSLSATLPPRKR